MWACVGRRPGSRRALFDVALSEGFARIPAQAVTAQRSFGDQRRRGAVEPEAHGECLAAARHVHDAARCQAPPPMDDERGQTDGGDARSQLVFSCSSSRVGSPPARRRSPPRSRRDFRRPRTPRRGSQGETQRSTVPRPNPNRKAGHDERAEYGSGDGRPTEGSREARAAEPLDQAEPDQQRSGRCEPAPGRARLLGLRVEEDEPQRKGRERDLAGRKQREMKSPRVEVRQRERREQRAQ